MATNSPKIIPSLGLGMRILELESWDGSWGNEIWIEWPGAVDSGKKRAGVAPFQELASGLID